MVSTVKSRNGDNPATNDDLRSRDFNDPRKLFLSLLSFRILPSNFLLEFNHGGKVRRVESNEGYLYTIGSNRRGLNRIKRGKINLTFSYF